VASTSIITTLQGKPSHLAGLFFVFMPGDKGLKHLFISTSAIRVYVWLVMIRGDVLHPVLNRMGMALVMLLATPSLSFGQEREMDCIPLPRVGSRDIIDNSTINFHMKDGRIYVMRLSFECPSLKFDDSFYYSVRGLRLCPTDVITNRSGFTCPIETIEILEDEQP